MKSVSVSMSSGNSLYPGFDSVSDDVSDTGSSLHVVSGSSVSLYVGTVKSLAGRGVGVLFLHVLSCTGISSVSLLDAALGSAIVRESM